MTGVSAATDRADVREGDGLEADARRWALAHRAVERAAGVFPAPYADQFGRALEQAQKRLAMLSGPEAGEAKAAEWFLDNYYLVRRVARQVEHELPAGFARRLPRLSAAAAHGRPRVHAVAHAFVVATKLELDGGLLHRFVDAYQTIVPLTVAELWALPTMLRAAVLRALLHFLADLHVLDVVHVAAPEEAGESLRLEPSLGVERCIRALRLLADIDWKRFFESTNRTEAVLRTDPAGVYRRMDFATCDSYRKAVEELAWNARAREEDVAARAIALAQQGAPDERRGHVGYYLVDAGRAVLEREIGYRARGRELVRRILTRRPTLTLLASLALAAAAPLLLVAAYLVRVGAHATGLIAGLAVASVPISMVAVTLVQWAIARLLTPRIIPKLDFSKGVPETARTLVVIPTLLGSSKDVESMLRQIELHYLANPDPLLQFALLTDAVDSKTPVPGIDDLLESATRGIDALNAKHGANGAGPFHLLHREPRWNAAEGCFMGWERKRGKLDELNRLLRGAKDTTYARHVGSPEGLEGIRFVITLDSDTQMPMEAAHRLIGLLAHPLNRPVYDAARGRVVSGHAIAQPRVETSPSSSRATLLSRIFAGDVGFDIYTRAVSDLYQDLFGSGIYVGKGIYDVDAFMSSTEGRFPQNTIASHDLLEGVHARAALATDVVFYEDYPSHLIAHARRMHRWVRGDWQLLPWLLPSVPSADGPRLRNPLVAGDRWKIADNLRRSLTSPLLFVFFVSSWTWLPGKAWVWTLGGLAVLLAPIAPGLLHDGQRRLENLARAGLALAFLAHETAVIVDAVARVLVRMTITRRGLLQWTTAAHTARTLGSSSSHRLFWREMLPSVLLAVGAAILVAWLRPTAWPFAAPVLIAWLAAPEIARWISRPTPSRVSAALAPGDLRELRRLARRTWLFFEMMVGPNDQWLPIDNHQEEPHEQTAHRTSPTNIGMMLLSVLAAHDLGYVGSRELSQRLRMSLESIARLVHYRGHLLNWYGTKNLDPLLPRYVSTVDSGNFAGTLLALEQGCRDIARTPVLRAATWEGLLDSLDLLESSVAGGAHPSADRVRNVLGRLRESFLRGRDCPDDGYALLRTACDETVVELDQALLAWLETGVYRHEVQALHALRTWDDRLHHQLEEMRREVEFLLPWLSLVDEPAAKPLALPAGLRLNEIPDAARKLLEGVEGWQRDLAAKGALTPELAASAGRLRAAFELAEANASVLVGELHDIAERAAGEANGMDFRLLYDDSRKLFHIGFNVTLDQLDGHHYDLLASEARLASYLAIVRREVPESHWYALGRPMTNVKSGPALLSWGGTMFEYLMPSLLMRSHPGTLLAQSCERAVEAQIAYGGRTKSPWGISESAYARLDAHQTYQYRSFGVPGLGFKRDLDTDVVIAPYASLLAVSIAPRAVVDNLRRLDAMGMVGTYGAFEALDMHPDRTPDGHQHAVVRSYMAHHQGMVLVALGNFLTGGRMIDRFHANPSVETGEMLLNERSPATAPAEWPIATSPEGPAAAPTALPVHAPAPWSPPSTGLPQAFAVSNGRLTSIVTDSGGGGLRWQGLSLTSFGAEPTHDLDGMWIYLRDDDSGSVWVATSEQGRTTYALHKAELHRRDHGVSVRVDIAVAPADDVEVREVTIHNETDRPRRLTVASATEPVLLRTEGASRHPAFARLFIESEAVAELDALVFARHLRSPSEDRAVLVQRLVHEGASVSPSGYETDRSAFFGRLPKDRVPAALGADVKPRAGRVGAVLDPVASLMASVELKPNATVTLAFVTTVARSRNAALELARKYGSMHAVRWAFRDAEQESVRRLQRAGLDAALVAPVQRLYSALLVADPAHRAPAAVLGAARPCKSRLWGRGISGDDPILLVRVHDTRSPLLAETIAAQRFLRSCGVRFDVIVFDEQASGYVTEGSGMLRSALAQLDVDDWLNRRGGIYVVPTDQLSDDEHRHLEASARVVLDTRNGGLSEHFGRVADAHPHLPRFEPSLANDERPGVVERPALLFDNGSGGFTEDGREYAIMVGPGEITPAPWCNVIANAEFGCIVSESSLGATWSENSGENRLTPWRNDPIFDTPSEALYLRDEETAAVWTPTPLPAGRDGPTLVRHGAGYTTYLHASNGLRQELTVFVPPDAPVKIVRLRLHNESSRHRRLTATYYAEWVLGSMREEQRAYIVSEVDEKNACLRATSHWNSEFGGRAAFLASERELHGFTTDRAEFLGRRGDYARPAALERWGLARRIDAGLDPCAAVQVHLELAPGESLETHFVLGQAANVDEAARLVAQYRRADEVSSAWTRTNAFWDDLLGSVRVKTPEPAMDLMLNRWLLYQAVAGRIFGRTGFYQSSGAFGYRDQLQDVLALLHGAPERARAHVLEAARHQFEEGDVLHWWHPPSGRGVRTRCSDDLLWLPFVVAEYVAATGDASILGETAPFLSGEPLRSDEHDRYAQYERAVQSGTIFEHCRRALERGVTRGEHGLPLMGDGDWNDGMNRVGEKGRGESVWLGWFAYATMRRFAELCERTHAANEASKWRERAETLRAAVEASAWDGGWYLRAFHDDGSVLGSAKSRECRIDSIAQSWAVLSGAADDARASMAVRAADEQLVREKDRLVLLLDPAFASMNHDPGYIRAYPPGIRENGGQYTHAATWLGWAHAMLRDGAGAERLFRILNPVLRTQAPDEVQHYRVEPYVLAGDVYGVAPWVGRGGWTWYTGAAAWAWRLGVEAILGLRRVDGALRIDPCIPPTWNGFEAWVRVGAQRFHVVVENPDAVSSGVATLTVDGIAQDPQRIQPRSAARGEHEIRVRLGSASRRPLSAVAS